jgi:hypothetical protein
MPIEPTVSRMVWYRPGPRDVVGGEHPIPQIDDTSPLHAMICGVLGPGRVNLAVFGADGTGPYPRVDVLLVQDEPVQPGQCTWMPYQKGQASAAPAVAKEAAENATATIAAKVTEAHAEIEARIKSVVAEGEAKVRALYDEIVMALQPSPKETPAADGGP